MMATSPGGHVHGTVVQRYEAAPVGIDLPDITGGPFRISRMKLPQPCSAGMSVPRVMAGTPSADRCRSQWRL